MTREQFSKWAGSLLAGLTLGVGVGILGGPAWAVCGFFVLGFWTLRGGRA